MERVIDRIFRKADAIQVLRGESSFPTRGVITACGREELQELSRPQGSLSAPLFLYMGDFEGLRQGDLLELGEERYRVLSARLIRGFGRIFCMRAVAERVEQREEDTV